MAGKLQKCRIFFAHIVQHADGAHGAVGKPDDLSPGPAKVALERLHPLHRRAEMLLKKLLEDVHEWIPGFEADSTLRMFRREDFVGECTSRRHGSLR